MIDGHLLDVSVDVDVCIPVLRNLPTAALLFVTLPRQVCFSGELGGL
jgi:hypothetical protein